MIPTYNPEPDYLKQTLESILGQAGDVEEQQIQIVDDCSTKSAPFTLVESYTVGRVTISQSSQNMGLASTWNQCIDQAKGEWVHILHQDDLVFPGFYAQLKAAILQNPGVGLAFTRFAFIDEEGHWTALSAIESRNAGLLDDAATRLAASQRIQCAAVVVRKDVYEKLGGFRTDLRYALDWEMWARVAEKYPVLYVPEILAGYRVHELSETHRINSSGARLADVARCLEINFSRLNHTLQRHATGARIQNALDGPRFAREHLIKGEFSRVLQLFRDSVKCSRSPMVVFAWFRLFAWAGIMGITQPFRRGLRRFSSNH